MSGGVYMIQPFAKQPLLPLAIKPKLHARESLYSWLLRAASYNGLSAPAFANLYWPNRNTSLWRGLINKNYPDESFKNIVTELCGETPCVFADFLDVNDLNKTFILLVHHVRKKGQIHEYQYCPKCIEEQQHNAYLPIEWDMASHTVCAKHHILLQNTCTNCGMFYTPHKAGLRPIEQCSYCGHAISLVNNDALTHTLYNGIDIPRLIKLQQQLNDLIDVKLNAQASTDSHLKYSSSFNYMGAQLDISDFLSLLIYFIRLTRYYSNTYKTYKNSMHRRFAEKMQWERYPLGYRFTGKFNTLPVVERAFLLSRACEILDLSADNWVQIAHEVSLKQGFFNIIRNKDELPEPFLQFIDELPVSKTGIRTVKQRPLGAPKSLNYVKSRWSKFLKKINRNSYV